MEEVKKINTNLDIKVNSTKNINFKSEKKIKEEPKKEVKKIEYKYAGRERITDFIHKSIPKEYIPTSLTGKILGYVFLIVLILSLFQFPLGTLLSGNPDIEIKVGLPWPFLVFSALDFNKSPLYIKELILDLILYLIISYAIEVIINLTMKGKKKIFDEKEKDKLKLFKDKKKDALSDRLTKRVFEKESPEKTFQKTTKLTDSLSKKPNTEKIIIPRQKATEVMEVPKKEIR